MMPATSAPNMAEYIRGCVAGRDLTSDEARQAIGLIMDGRATQAQVSALLVALCVKGETVEELIGAAQAMRARAVAVSCARRPLMDVCGTGGDGSGTFNISTAVAFVVAGAGIAVAKHGNRAMSSRCGSADVLEALGVRLESASAAAQELLDRNGIAFLLAQTHHPAMRHAAPIRKEIGVRTLFNLLGPLTNPAGATHQVVGVAQERALMLVAQALRALGGERAAVVHAVDGTDEVSLSCPTRVVEWTGERIIEYVLEPEMFGFRRGVLADVAGADPQTNASLIEGVLGGTRGPHRDIVLLNAALAVYISGVAPDLADGLARAQTSIDSGAAKRSLHSLVEATA